MSVGQAASAVAGAVVGFFVGGPAGAAYGFAAGLAAGSLLDPPKGPSQPGPKINDKNFQTAKYGDMLPRFYGTIGGSGNVTWIEGGKLKATVRKKKSGGKGGGSSASVKTVSYSATFFLSLGIGPIAGVRRIWCSDKLIYNAGSDDLETIIASNQAANGFKVYLGTDDQMPDPRYEADVGVGNAPAYRGEAYIAFYDFRLADFGDGLQGAQFKVEVVNQQVEFDTVTSHAMPATASWADIAWNGFTHCAIRSGASAAVSMDGKSWSAVDMPVSANWSSITAGDGKFCALASGTNLVATSDDGRFWTLGALPSAQTWTELLWTGELFVAVAGGNFCTSAKGFLSGLLWSSLAPMPSSSQWFSSATGDGETCIVSSFGPSNSQPRSAVSHDGGASWVEAVMDDVGAVWTGVAWNGEVFCAVGYDEFAFDTALGHFATSADGLTWQYGRMPIAAFFRDVRYGNGEFLAVGYLAGIGRLYASHDGETWRSVSDVAGFLANKASWNGAWYSVVGETSGTSRVVRLAVEFAQNQSLAGIVDAECDLSGLISADDVDTSGLSSVVRGYRVTGGTIRAALEPLQGAFPFDVIPSGYQIKCVPRGQASIATIPWEDLGATDGDTPGDILQQSREMDSQLPARTNIKYLDAAREYATSEQYAERINTAAINRIDRELPLVLTADEAAGVAEVLQNLAWLERTDNAFTLPPIYLDLEPSDVVAITTPQATYQLRLTEANYTPDGRIECKAKTNRAALYTPNATGGEGVAPDGTVGLLGTTAYQLLDIPVVDETLQNAPGISLAMTGYTSSWPGGILFRSSDDGQTWADLQAIPGQCTMGNAGAAMPARSGSMIDRGSTLVVYLISGELESITEAQMLVGANYAAYGVNGRWEIIRFQNSALNADGSYTLTTFVRGDRGTEQYTGTHQSGDVFVLLDDPDNAFVGYPTALIGVPMSYRGITSGASIDTDTDQAFTYAGVNLECLSPVDARGVRDGSGNFTGTFYRRSRLSSSWWTNGIEAPVGETTQSYEIDVMNGSTVVRTIAASTPAFAYSAAEQTDDFGSAQASITFRIFQLSSAVGRGYQLQVTL